MRDNKFDRDGMPFQFLEGRRAWVAAEFVDGTPCPVCHGRDLKRLEVCLGCDRSGFDHERWLQGMGLPVGARMNPDYVVDDQAAPEEAPKPTKYQKPKLRGGRS